MIVVKFSDDKKHMVIMNGGNVIYRGESSRFDQWGYLSGPLATRHVADVKKIDRESDSPRENFDFRDISAMERYFAETCKDGCECEEKFVNKFWPLFPKSERDAVSLGIIMLDRGVRIDTNRLSRMIDFLKKDLFDMKDSDDEEASRTARRYLLILEELDRKLRIDGTVPVDLKYFGTHTGRFTGEGRFSVHYLPKEKYKNVVDVRSLIVPRKGCRLAVIDYEQMEARVIAGISGMDEHSIYERIARDVLGWKGRELKKENPELYKKAKLTYLGCAYGAGSDRIAEMIGCSSDEAKKILARFKRNYYCLEKCRRSLFDKIEGQFEEHFKSPHSSDPVCATLQLPSGRMLRYYDLRFAGGRYTAKTLNGSKKTITISRGKLLENYVQAIARDVFVDGMSRLWSLGGNILFHVHDEFVLEFRESRVHDGVEEVRKILRDPPHWFNVNFDVDVKITDYYQ